MITSSMMLAEIAIDVAISAVLESGKILCTYFKEGSYNSKFKEDTSLQTTADLEAEKIIIKTITSKFPDHSIDAEESGLCNRGSMYKWIVDSLDGTENFTTGIPYFSSSIAFCIQDKPVVAVVYNPITEDLYTAIKGKGAFHNEHRIFVSKETQLRKCRVFFIPDFNTKRQQHTNHLRNKIYMLCRRMLDTWSPSLDWCLVASGKAELVLSLAQEPIRPDAGTLMLEEAGGKVTDFYNTPFEIGNDGRIVGSNRAIHDQLLQLIREE